MTLDYSVMPAAWFGDAFAARVGGGGDALTAPSECDVFDVFSESTQPAADAGMWRQFSQRMTIPRLSRDTSAKASEGQAEPPLCFQWFPTFVQSLS